MGGFGINTVVIAGNLTRDPELRTLPSGTNVCGIRLAVNERYKDGSEWKDRPNYFDVTVWAGIGEWCAKNLGKGDQIVVQGRLRWREWEKDGNKRQAVDIVADNISTPPTGGGGGGKAQRRAEQATGADFQAQPAGGFDAAPPGTTDVPAPAGDFAAAPAAGSADDDDIPF